MVTTDPYEDGAQETRQDFTANDFRITRALESLLLSAKSITGDAGSAEDIAARVQTLRGERHSKVHENLTRRATRSASEANASGRILIATSRFSFVSRS